MRIPRLTWRQPADGKRVVEPLLDGEALPWPLMGGYQIEASDRNFPVLVVRIAVDLADGDSYGQDSAEPPVRVPKRRGRPPCVPGFLSPDEVAQAVAERKRAGLRITQMDVAEDVSVSRRTLERALAYHRLDWRILVAR